MRRPRAGCGGEHHAFVPGPPEGFTRMARTTRSARSGFGICMLLAVALVAARSAEAGDVSVQLDAFTGFVIKNSAGSERLRVDGGTGNISRNGALFVHTTGATSNTFVGVNAG